MTATIAELHAAALALQSGAFRAIPTGSDVPAWTPDPDTIFVRGVGGGVGASVCALAIAEAKATNVRLIEACPISRSGYRVAGSGELGNDANGWRRATRQRVLIERPTVDAGPPHSFTGTTIVDVPWDTESPRALALTALSEQNSCTVLVARATIPSLMALELALTEISPTMVVVLGPPVKKWPKQLKHFTTVESIKSLLTEQLLIAMPLDQTIAVTGVTDQPLPHGLIEAGAHILDQLKMRNNA